MLTSVFAGRHSSPVVEAIFGMHFPEVRRVIDLTYGKGNFWKWEHPFEVVGADLKDTGTIKGDSRNLPLPNKSFDVAVIDPPFMHGGKPGTYASTVGLDADFSRLPTQRDVQDLYFEMMCEGNRLANHLVVKCKDTIEASKYIHTLGVVSQQALEIGLKLMDKVVFVPDVTLATDPKWTQRHFRRQESYFLIYKGC